MFKNTINQKPTKKASAYRPRQKKQQKQQPNTPNTQNTKIQLKQNIKHIHTTKYIKKLHNLQPT